MEGHPPAPVRAILLSMIIFFIGNGLTQFRNVFSCYDFAFRMFDFFFSDVFCVSVISLH